MLNKSNKKVMTVENRDATLLKLNRREFMKTTSAAALSTIAAGTLLGHLAQAAEPKSGGKFTFALATGGSSDTLDPATFTSITKAPPSNLVNGMDPACPVKCLPNEMFIL